MIPGNLGQALASVSKRHLRSERLRAGMLSLAFAWIAATCFYVTVHLAWGPPPAAGTALVFVAAAAVAGVLLHSAPPTEARVARMIDHRLELKDRLATALEYQDVDTEMAAWLREDAEQQSRFVEARNVVPLPPRLGPRGRLLLLALAASVAVWFAPLPAGVLTAKEALAPPGDSTGATEDEIFDRAAKLSDEIRTFQNPELQRVQRDLAHLQAGLRDRSLPKDEALALLDLLERRAQAALDALRSDTGVSPDSQADLDRLQDLADRLVAVASGAPSANAGAVRETIQQIRQVNAASLGENSELDRLIERLANSDPIGSSDDLLRAANELRDSIDRSRLESELSERENAAGGGENTGGAADVGGEGDRRQSANPGRGAAGPADGETPLDGEFDPEAANVTNEPGGEEFVFPGTGSGAQAGTEPGGDAAGEWISPDQVRELHYLPGEILDGPIRSGTVQTHLSLATQGPDLPGGATVFTPAASIDAEAIEREQIPLAYRETVKRYFQSLEPTSERE